MQVSEIHEDLVTSTISQNDWEIVEEYSRFEKSEVDGPQIHLDIQLTKREAVEEIHVEITTNDFDESQKRSLIDSSSHAEDDTFEILEAEAKQQELDFELVSRPGTGIEEDLISITSSQLGAIIKRSHVSLMFKRLNEEAKSEK